MNPGDKDYWKKRIQVAEECIDELGGAETIDKRRELALLLLLVDKLDSILTRLPQ